jgi:glucose-1-phosphatase
MPIRLVLFDLDGVLVDYDRHLRVRLLADALGHPHHAVQALLFDDGGGLEDRYDAGEIDTHAYLAAIGEALGCRMHANAWCAARSGAMRLPDDVLPAVEAVASRRDVGVLTNNGALIAEHWRTLLPALASLHGRVLCSGMLRASKPQAAIFERALAHFGHRAQDTLFLDDNAGNVAGARAAGLHAEQVLRPGDFAAILAAYGVA